MVPAQSIQMPVPNAFSSLRLVSTHGQGLYGCRPRYDIHCRSDSTCTALRDCPSKQLPDAMIDNLVVCTYQIRDTTRPRNQLHYVVMIWNALCLTVPSIKIIMTLQRATAEAILALQLSVRPRWPPLRPYSNPGHPGHPSRPSQASHPRSQWSRSPFQEVASVCAMALPLEPGNHFIR